MAFVSPRAIVCVSASLCPAVFLDRRRRSRPALPPRCHPHAENHGPRLPAAARAGTSPSLANLASSFPNLCNSASCRAISGTLDPWFESLWGRYLRTRTFWA